MSSDDVQLRFSALHSAGFPSLDLSITCAPSPCGPAFPASSAGRDACDYYGHSVAIGLAPRRRSRVPFGTERLEHDVGALLIPLNRFAIDRLSGEGYGAQKSNAPVLTASPVDAVARSVQFHRWGLGCKQCSFRLIMRALQDGTISVF